MKGYWINNNGGQASASPVSLLRETPSIGIAPILTPNSYDRSLTANCNYLLDVQNLTYSSSQMLTVPEGVTGKWQYNIANYTPNNVLPNNPWFGFTTTVQPVVGEDGIKYEWKAEQENPITMARVYQMKCKIIRIAPYVLNPYTLSDKQSYVTLMDYIDKLYEANFTDNTKLQLPIWTGQLAPGGGGGTTQGVATMKQNRHYAAVGVATPGQKYIYEDGIFLPHSTIQYVNPDYHQYSMFPIDVTVSPISMMRTGVVIPNNYTTDRDDIVHQRTSLGTTQGLPFFFNNTVTGMGRYATSGEFEFPSMPFNVNQTFATTGSEANQALVRLYGYKMEKSVTPLPHIASNQVVHFGDGRGVLDSTLLSKYVFRGIEYTNKASRYCYLQFNAKNRLTYVYFIITYLTNDIITITKHNQSDVLYGHFELNNKLEV